MIDDQFFKEIGMDDIDPKQKEELLDQLSELVENDMAQKLAATLSDEQMEQFDALLEENKDEEAYDYLLEVYPGYQVELQAAADRVKQAFVEDMEGLIQQVADKVVSEGDSPSTPTAPEATPAVVTAPVPAAAGEVTIGADGTPQQAADPAEAHSVVGDIPPVPAKLADTPQHVNDVPAVEESAPAPEAPAAPAEPVAPAAEPIAPGEAVAPAATEPIAPGEAVEPAEPQAAPTQTPPTV